MKTDVIEGQTDLYRGCGQCGLDHRPREGLGVNQMK